MFKKILKKVQGFSPVELVIMVGFGALAAGALIYMATTPHYMASTQPVNINVKLDSAITSRTPAAKAQATCNSTYVVPNGSGGLDVIPSGISPTDATNVQCAVNQGGTVVLRAKNASGVPTAFVFGDTENVYILQKVDISGIKDSNGNVTKISGGKDTFVVLGPEVSIWGPINFDKAIGTPILIAGARDTKVSGVTITNVQGGYQFIGDPFPLQGVGIFITDGANGNIVIENNDIDMDNSDIGYEADLGIAVFGVSSNLQILGNIIRSFSWNGMLVLDNFGTTVISKNTVAGLDNNPLWPVPTCIEVGNGYLVPGNTFGNYIITKNEVTVDHPSETGFAVIDTTIGAVISGNHVVMKDGLSGIDIWGQKNHNISQNRIEGDGLFAIDIMPFSNYGLFDVVENINFTGDNIVRFNPALAHIYLGVGANNNTFIGNAGTVINNGSNNTITGLTSVKGGVGSTVSDAMKRKKDLMKTLKSPY